MRKWFPWSAEMELKAHHDLARVRYDHRRERLWCTFRAGRPVGVYEYAQVPRGVWRRFHNSIREGTPTKWYWRHIHRMFPLVAAPAGVELTGLHILLREKEEREAREKEGKRSLT